MIKFNPCFPVFSKLSVFTSEKPSGPRHYWPWSWSFRLSGLSARKDPLHPSVFGAFRLSTLSAYYVSSKPPESGGGYLRSGGLRQESRPNKILINCAAWGGLDLSGSTRTRPAPIKAFGRGSYGGGVFNLWSLPKLDRSAVSLLRLGN